MFRFFSVHFIKASMITCMRTQLSRLCVFHVHRIRTPTRFSRSARIFSCFFVVCIPYRRTNLVLWYCKDWETERERVYLAIIANLQGNLYCRHCIGFIATGAAIAPPQLLFKNQMAAFLHPFHPFIFFSLLPHRVICSIAFTWLLFNCFNSIFHFDYMFALCDSVWHFTAFFHIVVFFFPFSCNLFDRAHTACSQY